MEARLLLIGFKCFKSKSEKMCYIISFLTPPVYSQDKISCFSSQIDIFTDAEKYNTFIKTHKILDNVTVKYEIKGDKVHYFI